MTDQTCPDEKDDRLPTVLAAIGYTTELREIAEILARHGYMTSSDRLIRIADAADEAIAL